MISYEDVDAWSGMIRVDSHVSQESRLEPLTIELLPAEA